MNALVDDALARNRVTPGATPQTPLRLLQTPQRRAAPRPVAAGLAVGQVPPLRGWAVRLSSWLRAGR